MTNVDRLLTPREVEEILKIKGTKLYYLLKSGELPSIHLGRSRRIRESEIGRFIERLSGEVA